MADSFEDFRKPNSNSFKSYKIIQLMCFYTRVHCQLLFMEGLLNTLNY